MAILMTDSKLIDWKKFFSRLEEQTIDFFLRSIAEEAKLVEPPLAVFDVGISECRFSLISQFVGFLLNAMYCGAPLGEGMLVWMHLYNVPLELYSRVGLSYIASAVGVPLYMGSIVATKGKLEFAKVCIEVGAGVKLLRIVNVKMRDGSMVALRVVIPWLLPCYSKCKVYGHNERVCHEETKEPEKVTKVGGVVSVESDVQVDDGAVEIYGEGLIIVDNSVVVLVEAFDTTVPKILDSNDIKFSSLQVFVQTKKSIGKGKKGLKGSSNQLDIL
ncbi:hypothetical protein V6N13_094343 [Hibiscus sabdariffa]